MPIARYPLADLPVELRVRILVDPAWGCWEWQHRDGPDSFMYGSVVWQGTSWPVHRLTYTLLAGAIPDGLDIDHVFARGCHSKGCCWPEHLEPVPPRLNAIRAGRGNWLKGVHPDAGRRIAMGSGDEHDRTLADAAWMLPFPALGDSGNRIEPQYEAPRIEGDPAYEPAAAAIVLGIPREQLDAWRHWRSNGAGPPWFQCAQRIYYRHSVIMAWQRSQAATPAA